VAEPDLKQGVSALKNRFNLGGPVTREEQDAARIRYERDIAPRLESITESYDRITKRRQGARLAEKRELELDESIKKLKAANAVAAAQPDASLIIGKRYGQVKDRIETLGYLRGDDGELFKDPVMEKDPVSGELVPTGDFTYLPASVAQMRENLRVANSLVDSFDLTNAVAAHENATAVSTSFRALLQRGKDRVNSARTERDRVTTLRKDMDEVRRYHKVGPEGASGLSASTEKYDAAISVFENTGDVPAFEKVINVGKADLKQARGRVQKRIERIDKLSDTVINKRKFIRTDPEAETTQVLGSVFMRAAHDPLFVRGVYREYLRLLEPPVRGEDEKEAAFKTRSDEFYKEYVGKTKDEVEGEDGQLAKKQTLKDGGKQESDFDKFANTLYDKIVDFLTREKFVAEEKALELGLPAPADRGTGLSPDVQRALENKFAVPEPD